ncbi:MAG: PorP/SprF family type IX secretion system membrane protein, partial [Bacteroidales bacterium]
KNFRSSKIVADEPGDMAIPTENINDIKPDFDFGVVFNSPVFSMGVSATHLTAFLYDKQDYFAPQLGGHAFMEVRAKCTENFTLIPNISAIYVNKLLQAEFNLTALFQKIWWLGASYRLNDAIVAMVGFQVKGFRFGYAYDIPMGAMRGYTSGSHEIMLNVRIKSTNEVDQAQQTPRFFE